MELIPARLDVDHATVSSSCSSYFRYHRPFLSLTECAVCFKSYSSLGYNACYDYDGFGELWIITFDVIVREHIHKDKELTYHLLASFFLLQKRVSLHLQRPRSERIVATATVHVRRSVS